MIPRFLSHASTRRDAWLLFGFALVVLATGMGLRDPWPADEPRFALVAKQMWDSGNFLIPHRGIEPYSDKPPVFMWLQLAGHALTGSWRLAFLLPSLLAALGTLALVYDLSRRAWSARAATSVKSSCRSSKLTHTWSLRSRRHAASSRSAPPTSRNITSTPSCSRCPMVRAIRTPRRIQA